MKTLTLAIATSPLVLAACGSAPAGDPWLPAGMPPTPMTQVMYGCETGETIEMRFFPEQGVAVLVRQGLTHELHPQPVAYGFHYTNGPYGVRGKSDELQLEVGRMAPIACRVLP